MPTSASSLPAIALRASAISGTLQTHQAVIEPGFVALGRHLGGIQAAASALLGAGDTGATADAVTTVSAPGIASPPRALLEHAAAVAYHLQFGDIIRQKHEHVVAALGDIARWLAVAAPQLDSHLRATEADCLLALQTSQLEAIRHDVVFIGKHLVEHFTSIRTASERLAGFADAADADLAHLACIARELPLGLAFLEEFAGSLERDLESLESLRDSLQPWLITGLDLSALLARYATRYTTIAGRERDRLPAAATAGDPASGAGEVSFF